MSDYDKKKQSVDKLAADMVKSSGCNSEWAARKAAEVANKSDAKDPKKR